jgi:Tfp pilus assembly protein PilO
MSMQMNARERALAFIVGTLAAVLVTFMLVKVFLKHQRQLTQQIADKTATLGAMRTLIAERELWEQRDAWLNQNQPRLDNANSAGVELLEQIKQIGQKRSLTPTEAQIGIADGGGKATGHAYQAVSVSFTLKGKWQDLVNFLYDVQSPTNFLVFEKATLQLDKEDKTQVSGTFRLAKWFASP